MRALIVVLSLLPACTHAPRVARPQAHAPDVAQSQPSAPSEERSLGVAPAPREAPHEEVARPLCPPAESARFSKTRRPPPFSAPQRLGVTRYVVTSEKGRTGFTIGCPLLQVCDRHYRYRELQYRQSGVTIDLFFDPSAVDACTVDDFSRAFSNANVWVLPPELASKAETAQLAFDPPRVTLLRYDAGRLSGRIEADNVRIVTVKTDRACSYMADSESPIPAWCTRTQVLTEPLRIDFDLAVERGIKDCHVGGFSEERPLGCG